MAICSGTGTSASDLDPEAVAEQTYDEVIMDIPDVKRDHTQAVFNRISKQI